MCVRWDYHVSEIVKEANGGIIKLGTGYKEKRKLCRNLEEQVRGY